MVVAFCLILPRFESSLENIKLRADAEQMAYIIRHCRQEAVFSGEGKWVKFYPQNAKYKEGKSVYYLNEGISFVGKTTFTRKIGEQPACIFRPSGAPGSAGTVTLKNRFSRVYIIVNPAAGRIRVSDTAPESWQ